MVESVWSSITYPFVIIGETEQFKIRNKINFAKNGYCINFNSLSNIFRFNLRSLNQVFDP